MANLTNSSLIPNITEIYFSSNGTVLETIGTGIFHAQNNYSNIISVYIEDGNGDNTTTLINFSPKKYQATVKPLYTSHWFFMSYVGEEQKTLASETRSFSHFVVKVPNTILRYNNLSLTQNTVTVIQRYGTNYVGSFKTLSDLRNALPDDTNFSVTGTVSNPYTLTAISPTPSVGQIYLVTNNTIAIASGNTFSTISAMLAATTSIASGDILYVSTLKAYYRYDGGDRTQIENYTLYQSPLPFATSAYKYLGGGASNFNNWEYYLTPDNLADGLYTAYVISEAGFFQVTESDEELLWTETQQIQAALQTKQYNTFEISVQSGLSSDLDVTPITVNASAVIMQAVSEIEQQYVESNQALVSHLDDTANPHRTTISNLEDTAVTTPINGQVLRYSTTSGKWEQSGTLTTAESDISDLQGRMNDAESDIDDLESTQANIIDGIQDITYDNTISELTATTVKDALDEIDANVDSAQEDIETHVARTDNPHQVTKTQVGLSNVDNTSDMDKPVSTATQNALDNKVDLNPSVVTALSSTDFIYGQQGGAEKRITVTDLKTSIIENLVAFGYVLFSEKDEDGQPVIDNPQTNKIYLFNPSLDLESPAPDTPNNSYEEWIYITEDDIFEKIGDTAIALTDYYDKAQLDAGQLDNRYYTEEETDALLLDKVDVGTMSSNIVLFPTTADSNVTGYKRMVTSLDDEDFDTTAVNVPTGSITGTGILVGQLIADANLFVGNPGIVNITTIGNIRKVGGNQNQNATFYFKVFQRKANTTEILVATSETTGAITSSTYTEFFASALLNNGTFEATDRIVIRYYADVVGNPFASYEFQFGGTSPIRTLIPVPVNVLLNLDIDDINGLQEALDAINQDTNTTHTQIESIKSVPVGTVDGQVSGFEAEGLTLENSVVNGDFSDGTTGWTATNTSSFTVASNVASFTASATNGLIFAPITTQVNSKYFVNAKIKSSSNLVSIRISDAVTFNTTLVSHSGSGNFETLSSTFTMTSPAATNIQVRDTRTTGFTEIQVKDFMLINMTALGIASYTEAQMLDLVRSGYFDGLTSVEQPSITSVGKNLFDGHNLELGTYDGFTGVKSSRNSSIRTIDKKAILPSTTYRFSMSTAATNNIIFYYYDSSDVFLGVASRTLLGAGTGGTFTTPSTAATYNISIVNTLDTTSPSFDNNYQLELGTVATAYEPYKSSTLALNTPLRRLPNGVRDRVYEQNGEVWLEKRVEARPITTSDIVGFSTSNPIVDRVILENIIVVNSDSVEGKTIIEGFMPEVAYQTSSTAYPEYSHYTNAEFNSIVLNVPKGTYANLAAAQADLAGTLIQYQLATPQLINLTQEGLADGQLTAYANGTIYNTSDTFHADIQFDVASNRSAQITALIENSDYQAKLIDTKSNVGHTHLKADITDFAHTHAIADVTNLQTSLDGKVAKTGDTITGQLNVISSATNQIPLVVDTPSGHATSVQVWRVNNLGVADINAFGDFSGRNILISQGVASSAGTTRAYVRPTSNGTIIERNIADTNPALIVNQVNASSTGDILKVQAAGTDRLTVKQNGRVGIGTNNPLAVFHVAGDSYLVGSTLTNIIRPYSTEVLTVGQGGNNITYFNSKVGVFKNNPTEALDVTGNIKASGTIVASGEITAPSIKLGTWRIISDESSATLNFQVV